MMRENSRIIVIYFPFRYSGTIYQKTSLFVCTGMQQKLFQRIKSYMYKLDNKSS